MSQYLYVTGIKTLSNQFANIKIISKICSLSSHDFKNKGQEIYSFVDFSQVI